jgi:hypothetical protein
VARHCTNRRGPQEEPNAASAYYASPGTRLRTARHITVKHSAGRAPVVQLFDGHLGSGIHILLAIGIGAAVGLLLCTCTVVCCVAVCGVVVCWWWWWLM